LASIVETSSQCCSKENEEENLCLMVGYKLAANSVSSSISINYEKYSSLLEAFKETHKEAKKLALSNNKLKRLNNVKMLECLELTT